MYCRIALFVAICGFGVLCGPASLEAGAEPTRAEAAAALRKAVGFFRSKVSINGGYLWRYSADLSVREGEREAGAETAWVQPPGTPTVGEAYLRAYRMTGDVYYLDAARETVLALVAGQLRSGGWDYRIEFNPRQRSRYAYRIDEKSKGSRNVTTLDDDITQSALRYLMQFDRATEFKHETVHAAVEFALSSLLEAQYPNGAWPQRFSEFPNPEEFPVLKASFQKTWSRKYEKQDYRGHYTFNDNSIADTIDVMFLARDIYGEKRYELAAEKAGDFILLSQLPEPQPGWAQQYDHDMHPAWARRFEPPAVTGGESQGIMRTLLTLYRQTGKQKYLEPLPRALAYYKRSTLPDGRLARFYEIKTNRPLYFVKDSYELTYSSENMPTHYGFIVGSRLDSIEREYKKLLKTDPAKLNPPLKQPVYRMSASLTARATSVIEAMDSRGAWVEAGSLKYAGKTETMIDSRTFTKNVEVLAKFLAASK